MSVPLWEPSEQRIRNTNMYRFMQQVNSRYNSGFTNYSELYEWSVENICECWEEIFRFCGIISSRPFRKVIEDENRMPVTEWFPGCRLNFAENLLRFRDERPALVFRGEDTVRRTLTYAGLFQQTSRVASALKEAGVGIGDRVAGYMPNMIETVVAMLATASLGAVWSSCSPDFGIKGVLDRFGQIRPKVLFTADCYYFKGRRFDIQEKTSEIVAQIPSIEKVVVASYSGEQFSDPGTLDKAICYEDFRRSEAEEADFVQLPFDAPLYIMYSSGTTGLPKCMVQSGGGVLINHLKELFLHTDLKREDTIFYFTTCGWMMWNWLQSSLAAGATVVLYDGNPFHPGPEALWQMAEEEGVSIFGTSAGYIAALKKAGVRPGRIFDLSKLKALLSTGSPLSVEDFHFIYDEVKKDVQLASISGGSDLNGCFALGNPIGPVYAGELQCRGLGMKVFAFDEEGNEIVGRQGELVCTAPFPSMPIYFWDDADGSKYRAAYFDRFPGIWTHGDFIELTERGGVIFYGRSDATLNPGGVRIGTAEIYRVMDNVAEVADSVVVGQRYRGDTRVILFVKMIPGNLLTDDIRKRIGDTIRREISPRHVPAMIISAPDIPYTLNMKKVELAVQKMIHGQEVKNRDALMNPESLDFFASIAELREVSG